MQELRLAPGTSGLRLFLRRLLLLLFLLLLAFWPLESRALLRDADFIRQTSPPYVAQALKELKTCEQHLQQGRGNREQILLRLSQLCYLLGELTEGGQRLPYYEKGRDYAERLLEEKPHSVKGLYWLAQNLCGVAEVGGAGRALTLLPDIVELLEEVAARDPAYDQAGAHRALGSIYYQAPDWPLSVGDRQKALHHLRLAVKIAPENSTNHLLLGDLLLRLGKKKEARAELARVLSSRRHSVWPLGVEHDRREARRLLAQMQD